LRNGIFYHFHEEKRNKKTQKNVPIENRIAQIDSDTSKMFISVLGSLATTTPRLYKAFEGLFA